MSEERPPPFRYPLDACDVHDRMSLAAYRACRLRWLDWLSGDAHNSINRQLYGLMWDDAAFRALNLARRFATKEHPTAAVAPLLAGLIDQGFVATQILAISRLVDHRKDVISLRRLLDDIEAHAHLITRENYVCHDGLPFDHETPTWPDPMEFSPMAHAKFDEVAGTKGSPRTRFDRFGPEVFAGIRALLAAPEIEHVITLRHKFVAHAADANSRAKKGVERHGLTLNQLEAAQKALVQAAQRIELDLLWGSSRGVVPIPHDDQLAHLDAPVVPAARIKELHRWWHEHSKSREAWTKHAWPKPQPIPSATQPTPVPFQQKGQTTDDHRSAVDR
jgi:hypothetical protein